MNRVINGVKFVSFISRQHLLLQLMQLVEGPAVQLFKFSIIYGHGRRFKIIKVGQEKPEGIPDAAIGFHQPRQNFPGDADVVTIILGRDPEAQDFRPIFLDHFIGSDDVAGRLGHFLAGPVHHKTMGQHRFVGTDAPGAHRSQQGTVKPAAMLVASFQVEVGRVTEIIPVQEHGGITGAGIKPDVQDVGFRLKLPMSTGWTHSSLRQEKGRRFRKPDISTMFGKKIGHPVHQGFIHQGFATFLTIKNRNRHSPDPLAGDAPVGTVFNHPVDALPAPLRNPLHPIYGLKGPLPQVIALHGNKPLLGGTENNRFFTAPAVGIGMGKRLAGHQEAQLRQLVNNSLVGVKNKLAGKKLHLVRKPALIVDRGIGFQPILQTNLIVFLSVSGGRMDAAGPGLQGHMIAQDNQRQAIVKGMTAVKTLQGPGVDLSQNFNLSQFRFGAELLLQAGGNNIHIPAGGPQSDILQLGMQGNGQVGRNSPGSGSPDNQKNPATSQKSIRGGNIFHQRKFHVNGRRGIIFILNLGLGQGGIAGGAPVNGFFLFEKTAVAGKFGQLPNNGSFIRKVHGQVGPFPFTENTQPDKLLPLNINEFIGISATGPADLHLAHLFLTAPEIFIHLVFDRQAVAIPAGYIMAAKTSQGARLDDNILQNLVQGVPHVEMSIGIGRPVMKDKTLGILSFLKHPPIHILVFPGLNELRLPFCQVPAHGKSGFGQIQSFLVIHGIHLLTKRKAKQKELLAQWQVALS